MDIWDAHSGEVLAILFAQRTFTNLIDLCIEVDIQGEEEVDNLVHLFSVHIVEFSSLFPRLENLDIRLHTPDPEEFVAEEAKQKLAKILDTSPYLNVDYRQARRRKRGSAGATTLLRGNRTRRKMMGIGGDE
ncbi:hypothetical protein FRC17_005580 [Serendipita sp. 399]|nr:hypothetical protein FRC17_005580 [Serendipita sp. 399]